MAESAAGVELDAGEEVLVDEYSRGFAYGPLVILAITAIAIEVFYGGLTADTAVGFVVMTMVFVFLMRRFRTVVTTERVFVSGPGPGIARELSLADVEKVDTYPFVRGLWGTLRLRAGEDDKPIMVIGIPDHHSVAEQIREAAAAA